MKKINIEAGSFRDPVGRIFYYNDKVYRVLSNEGLERYRFLKKNNLLKQLIHNNYVIRTNQVATQKLNLKEIPSKYVFGA